MKVNRERAIAIVTVSAAVIAYCEVLRTLDSAQTNRELRSAAHDIRHTNDYFVRMSRQPTRRWRRR